MSFRQFLPIPIFIAVLAVTLVMLAPPSRLVVPHLWTWISFQAWAMYFLAGCTLKGGVKVLLGYLAGAIASVAIMELMGVLAPHLGDAGALSAAVFVVVIGVICGERIPWFDFVPAWFVGAGVFFGVMSLEKGATYLSTGTHLTVSCAVGLVYGVVTVFLRVRYEGWLKARQPAPSVKATPVPEAITSDE